jgi:nitric oxide synthase oxygenase domain/subunit
VAPRITHHAPATAARQEAARLIRLAAEPRASGEQIKVSIMRAATRLGWPLRRVAAIWRMEVRRIDSWEMDTLRKIARNHRHNRSGEWKHPRVSGHG